MTDEEKAGLGYSTAIHMISYEGHLIWYSFAAMLAANSVIIALAGFGAKMFPTLAGQKLIPCFGIVICICWLLVTARQYCTYGYWFSWARTLESKYLGPVVQIVSVGAEFANGNTVTVGTEKQRLSYLGRLFRIQWLIYVIIFTFIFFYSLLFRL